MGDLAVDVLWDTAKLLETEAAGEAMCAAYADEVDGGGHEYNLGNLVCLGKKPAGNDPVEGDFFTPEGTRPLAIVNCDNRIVASAARIRWEELLTNWVGMEQQGFLKGRSILKNLIDVDTESMSVSLKSQNGAMILFDFKAAFPSISQEYMLRVLSRIGVPECARQVVTWLYDDDKCLLSLRGALHPRFAMTAGVRQGCPLSPLLYAVISDILLARILEECPDMCVRAYADDTAVVTSDFWRDAPRLRRVFDEFAKLSGLHLNIGKCVIIPLTTTPLQEVRERLANDIPEWRNMQVAWSGTYLGFVIGPEKQDQSWHRATTKYQSRVAAWAKQGLGLQYDAMVYNTFAITTLAYIAQLEAPPCWLLQEEGKCLRTAAPGPGKWAVPTDLWCLHESFGLARSFKSLGWLVRAAQLRVRVIDPSCCMRREFDERVRMLRHAIDVPDVPYTKATWARWYSQSFLLRLDDNYQRFVNDVCSIQVLRNDILGSGVGNSTPSAKQAIKRNMQRAAYNLLLRHEAPSALERVRHNLKRWKLSDMSRRPHVMLSVRQKTPSWQAEKTLHNLRLLGNLVPPRVVAAVFSTIWNRWTTHRRFQQRSSVTNVCSLGCSKEAENSIEHYANCACVRELGTRYLRLQGRQQINSHTFMLCNPKLTTQEDLTKAALLVYATYRAVNHQRHNPPLPHGAIYNAMTQWVREGALGHRCATQVMQKRWLATPPCTHLPSIPTYLPPTTLGAKRPNTVSETAADADTRKRHRHRQPEMTRIATPRTNRTSDAPTTLATFPQPDLAETLGVCARTHTPQAYVLPDRPQETIGQSAARSEHPTLDSSDADDSRDMCEPECSDFPRGTHHPNCSQYILG